MAYPPSQATIATPTSAANRRVPAPATRAPLFFDFATVRERLAEDLIELGSAVREFAHAHARALEVPQVLLGLLDHGFGQRAGAGREVKGTFGHLRYLRGCDPGDGGLGLEDKQEVPRCLGPSVHIVRLRAYSMMVKSTLSTCSFPVRILSIVASSGSASSWIFAQAALADS